MNSVPARKLWKVTLRGNYCSGYRESYVVSDNPNDALSRVVRELESVNIGSPLDRSPLKIELIADEDRYSGCGTMLYL